MLKSLYIGLILLAATSLLSLIQHDLTIIIKYAGTIGLLFMVLSAVFSGALLSGDRVRANNSNESPDETRRRFKLMTKLFLIGIPNLLVSAVLYFFIYIT